MQNRRKNFLERIITRVACRLRYETNTIMLQIVETSGITATEAKN